MDKLSDVEFAVTSFILKSKRHNYCFDKCFTEFDKYIKDDQHSCISK